MKQKKMKICNYHIILASNSPRRQELLRGLGVDFEVKVMPNVDESYPMDLPKQQVAEYISRKKASVYNVEAGQLIVTADTIVLLNDWVMGKPSTEKEAYDMLKALSGQTHEVITGVTLRSIDTMKSFSVSTKVGFATLSDDEIFHYISTYKPFDKAGAYGIQEWIGYVGVTHLEGSYFNVMGLPVQRIYTELCAF